MEEVEEALDEESPFELHPVSSPHTERQLYLPSNPQLPNWLELPCSDKRPIALEGLWEWYAVLQHGAEVVMDLTHPLGERVCTQYALG